MALSGPTSVTLGTQTSPALLLSAVNVQKVCTCRSSGSSFWSSCHTCHPWRSRRTDVTQLRLRSLWRITAVLVNELENRRTGGPEEETGEAPWGEEAWVSWVGLFVEKVSTLSRFTACRALVLTGGHGVPESRTRLPSKAASSRGKRIRSGWALSAVRPGPDPEGRAAPRRHREGS